MYYAYVAIEGGKKVELRIWSKNPHDFQVAETQDIEEHKYEHGGIETRVFRNHRPLPVHYTDVMLLAKDEPDLVDPVAVLWLRFLSERATHARKHGRTYAQTIWDTKARESGGELPDDWLGDGAISELAEVAVGTRYWKSTDDKEETLMEYEVANGASNHWRYLRALGRARC